MAWFIINNYPQQFHIGINLSFEDNTILCEGDALAAFLKGYKIQFILGRNV